MTYHSRYLAHDSQLMTETPSSTVLHISREIDTGPAGDSATINHFLARNMQRRYYQVRNKKLI
jgi:hypothetical protein